ncbi:hypothetical protein BC832DRAFT_588764 [Gaertneriomyces semiglobifer]|nr:hypothetical protein BC832DRAFT_588764 [Gaertneriomyces semiglobifer]
MEGKVISPRGYQEELLKLGKAGNVIAVADTGAGKTLISVLLIKHVVRQEALSLGHGRRICVFLAPVVPLVIQQAQYIRFNCEYKVKHFVGEMGVDGWPLHRWRKEIAETDVMVMTPDILKWLLSRAYVTMKEIALLILDEAHHARKKHAYNQIMSLFYHPMSPDLRPKIFGMTASPAFGKNDSQKAITQLEKDLDCQACTVAPEAVLPFAAQAEEEVVFYRQDSVAPLPLLFYLLSGYSDDEILKKPLAKAPEHAATLGPWLAERALELAVQEAEAHAKRKYSLRKNESGRFTPQEVDAALRTFNALTHIREKVLEQLPAHQPPSKQNVSGKVAVLMNLLKRFESQADDFRAIIFVQQRVVAEALCCAITQWKELAFIKACTLVGHGSSGWDGGNPAMTIAQQNAAVKAFRTGTVNLLLATRVAEEGLDIQQCMLVVRFDFPESLTNYIQSRGRARKSGSRFVLLCNQDCMAEEELLARLRHKEVEMRAFMQQRDREEDDDASLTLQPEADQIYRVESTGASISIYSAMSALYIYCDQLPSDGFTDTKPVFQVLEAMGCFHADVRLPMSVPNEARYFHGRDATTKKEAKQWAALAAIAKLHQLGELDDHLKPPKRSVPVADVCQDKNENTGKSRKREVLDYRMKIPRVLERKADGSSPTWFCLLSICHQNVTRVMDCGLLSIGDKPLPKTNFPICLGDTLAYIHIHPFTLPLSLSVERLDAIRRFHAVLFQGMLRSEIPDDGDWAMMTVPIFRTNDVLSKAEALDPFNIIDWDVVQLSSCARREVLSVPGFLERSDVAGFILHDRVHYNRKYAINQVLHGHSPVDEIEPIKGKFKTVGEYYQHRLQCTETIERRQPVIVATAISGITQSLQVAQNHTSTYLIPQFCTIYPIPARLLQGDALHLPLLLQHLFHHVLVLELKHDLWAVADNVGLLHLDAPSELLTAALTAPGVHPTANYERLETLGDAFMKMYQSVHLYASNPTWHEGRLTAERSMIERNSNLRQRACGLGLEGYINGTPLSRKHWTPFTMNGGGTVHRLSDKMVADVVEAIIGACTIGGGTRGGADALRKLLGDAYELDWTLYAQKVASSRMEVDVTVLGRSIASLEADIQYSFNDRSLAAEALTHPSAQEIALVSQCYQRLEFLGDAVLGYVITRYLYTLEPPMSPGVLTSVRSDLVNNQFLACISCTLGLPQKLEHMDGRLSCAMMTFAQTLDELAVNTADDASRQYVNGADGVPLYWRWKDLEAAPKVLGDIYEAVLGAVFVDSGFDLEAVWRIVERTLVKPSQV